MSYSLWFESSDEFIYQVNQILDSFAGVQDKF